MFEFDEQNCCVNPHNFIIVQQAISENSQQIEEEKDHIDDNALFYNMGRALSEVIEDTQLENEENSFYNTTELLSSIM